MDSATGTRHPPIVTTGSSLFPSDLLTGHEPGSGWTAGTAWPRRVRSTEEVAGNGVARPPGSLRFTARPPSARYPLWRVVGALLGAALVRDVQAEPAGDRVEAIPTATRFAVARTDTGWWLRSPTGDPLFSLGVCCVVPGVSRDLFDPENPGYAAWQHHDSTASWADASLRRLRSWGFTTLGAWSDFDALCASSEQTLWLAPVLHIGSTAGAPWWDMWDASNLRRMEETARQQIRPLRNNPRVIGYFSDNELGWWNATLWKMTFEQKPSSGQRRRLIQLLRDTYRNDWQKLLTDFEPENATNWSQLGRSGMLYLKSGGDGIRTMRGFLGLLADRYYQLMRDLIRREDPRALFLGDRYQSFYYPEVAQASARYVDVSSSNLNAHWNDGTFLRCYLDTLHALTGRPILVSEFYLAAAENRSGNRNDQGIFPVAITQAARAEGARRTLQALTALPYVVGADWFQLADEPRHGRDDGENFNFGLVDIQDRPYEDLTAMFASLNPADLKARPRSPRPDASVGVPPAPADPFAEFTPTRALKHWDRERGFVKPASAFPLGDLYLSWNERALYLGLYVSDIVEAAAYRSAAVPKRDRALWTVDLDSRQLVRARIGSGREAVLNEPRVRLESLSGLGLNVRNIAALEIPATLLGRDRFRTGDRIALDTTLLTHCRAYRMGWRGSFTLVE
jgi:hypothetical protein